MTVPWLKVTNPQLNSFGGKVDVGRILRLIGSCCGDSLVISNGVASASFCLRVDESEIRGTYKLARVFAGRMDCRENKALLGSSQIAASLIEPFNKQAGKMFRKSDDKTKVERQAMTRTALEGAITERVKNCSAECEEFAA